MPHWVADQCDLFKQGTGYGPGAVADQCVRFRTAKGSNPAFGKCFAHCFLGAEEVKDPHTCMLNKQLDS